MKKVVAIVSAVILVGCLAVVLCACGAKDEDITTSPNNLTTTQGEGTMNDGMVTDESEKDDNGILGDIVTDVSEGVSDIVTDVSEDVSDIMD